MVMSKYSLDELKWKEFKVADIFVIKNGYYNKRPPKDNGGKIPFLSATQYNNGVSSYYNKSTILKYDKVGNLSNKDAKERIFKGNCIAITNNGSVGHAFYQEKSFTCSHDVTPVYGRFKLLSREISLFIIPLIVKAGEGFGYAKKWRPKRMRKSRIMLPVDAQNNPNWRFMEGYVKQEQAKYAQRIIDSCEQETVGFGSELPGLDDVEWKEFFIGGKDGLFKISSTRSGIDMNGIVEKHGDVPYITRSSFNNGVHMFIGKEQDEKYKTNKGNVITVGLDTQTVFYQPNDFFTGQNIQVLENKFLNEKIALFLVSLLKVQMRKFGWGSTGATLTRLNRTKILIPVDSNGAPNWWFMENYTKRVQSEMAQKISIYCKKKLKLKDVS